MNIHSSTKIHPTSIIDEGAEIGENTKIWHWVHICKTSIIGKNCSIGQNVFIGEKTIIGNNVKVQNNVSIFTNVIIEDNVFCGPSMVFTNVYNPRSLFPRKDQYLRTHIEHGVTIGANATVVCGIRMGHDSFIGAGTLVNKDVKPFALIVGNPGKQIGWMSRYGERINLPLQGEGIWVCPHTNDKYQLQDSDLVIKQN